MSTLDCHLAAQRELRASPTFALVLQHALVLGNFLNHGNARLGGASGFRLKSLNKLADTRALVRQGGGPACLACCYCRAQAMLLLVTHQFC